MIETRWRSKSKKTTKQHPIQRSRHGTNHISQKPNQTQTLKQQPARYHHHHKHQVPESSIHDFFYIQNQHKQRLLKKTEKEKGLTEAKREMICEGAERG